MLSGAPSVRLSVAMPLYNFEEGAAASVAAVRAHLEALPYPCEFIAVDDGSRDATLARAREAAEGRPGCRVLAQDKNRGKGACVGLAARAARGEYFVFLDADLAYPPSEIDKITAALDAGADVAVACRVLPESRFVMSPSFFRYLYTRHLLGRFFNLIVRWAVLPGVWDTQAGLKGFRRAAALDVFSRQTLRRFSFDVEALFVARRLGLRVEQVPVFFGYFYEASTVRFLEDTVNMLADLAKVRWNGLRGVYDAPVADAVSEAGGDGKGGGS